MKYPGDVQRIGHSVMSKGCVRQYILLGVWREAGGRGAGTVRAYPGYHLHASVVAYAMGRGDVADVQACWVIICKTH